MTLSRGHYVTFLYNGKPRAGLIERVYNGGLTLKLQDGTFKSFTRGKWDLFINHGYNPRTLKV